MKPLLPPLLLAALTACGTPTTTSPGASSPGEGPIDLSGGSSAEPAVTPAACSDDLPMLCPGAETPSWQLADFQPKSAKNGTTYGLEAFRGKVTVVALFSGW